MNERYRIGLDIGGTFTDFVLISNLGTLRLHKCLTTPDNPAIGAMQGLRELLNKANLHLSDIDQIVHGTTLVTNAIIERYGAKTALLTTQGFRDVVEMGFEQRYDIYDLFLQFPDPLVPRHLRFEINERMDRDGQPITELDVSQLDGVAKQLLANDVKAIAISFLHSYRNPTHEISAATYLREQYPQFVLSVSHEVVSEIHEYERTITTVANAYVQPLMDRYLNELTQQLVQGGFVGKLLLMQSSGGLASIETARSLPIRFLESGPAGGALVTGFFGRNLAMDNLLAFDMGGTTAKAALIRDGQPDIAPMIEAGRVRRFKPGSGLPIKAPVVDMIEIGAGGGSIASVDTMGLLKVGPQSAGADPGPACYEQGGKHPTVTDACLLLGYFDPGYFLGGEMTLSDQRAEEVYNTLAAELGLSLQETAWGVYRLVCENMAQAARVHVIEKGQDPRRFAMMAFGGAGPAHAARVARILGASEVIVPRLSGVASALGFLVSPISFTFTLSAPHLLHDMDWQDVERTFTNLQQRASDVLIEAGVSAEQIVFERSADMRFAGQFHDLEITLPDGSFTREYGDTLAKRFKAQYETLYHTVLDDYEPMVLNWRLRARGSEPEINVSYDMSQSEPVQKGARRAYFPETSGYTMTPVYDRDTLPSNTRITGPAIVEERESTTVVGKGDVLTIDQFGNLRIAIAR